jgi:hypothetical protein
VRRVTLLLLSILLASAALAAVTITNVTEWYVRAVAPPVWKLGNASFSPLLGSWWSPLGGLNVTYYRLRFVPGWREEYVVGRVVNSSPAVAHFEKVSEAGSGTYSIYLGGWLQLSNSQGGGPDVPLPAGILWSSTASGRYSVSAWLVFRSGATARQLVNFTAEPMSQLYTASRACSYRSLTDSFAGGCVRANYSFSVSVPNNRTYVSGRGRVSRDIYTGNPPPSLETYSQQGYASFFIDYSRSPFSASTSFAFQYMFSNSLQDSDYIEVNFFVDTNGDGSPDLEVIYYGSGRGATPESMASVIYGNTLPVVARPMPGFTNRQNIWYTISISQVYSTGVVVGLAFTTYSPSGNVDAWWDNVDFQKCAPPSYLGAVTNGGSVTMVYVDDVSSPSTPPSVATEVDARCTGDPSACYGLSAAVYSIGARLGAPVAAAGFSFSVKGLYVKSASDVRNNVAYVSVGVDSDGDGNVDTEYIFYRNDTVGGSGWIAPVFSTTTTVYRYYLGAMAPNGSYVWSGSLPSGQQGSALYIAFAAVDASGNADGTADDFWVFWDDLSFSYYACDPLPSGWSSSGDVIYRGLVPGGISYAANFTGAYPYGFYFLDGSLNPVFGVNITSTGTYRVVCGTGSYTFTVSNVYWVDLRSLSGVYEAILRDSSGGILARYACSPPSGVSYVGFKNVQSFTLNIWGVPP